MHRSIKKITVSSLYEKDARGKLLAYSGKWNLLLACSVIIDLNISYIQLWVCCLSLFNLERSHYYAVSTNRHHRSFLVPQNVLPYLKCHKVWDFPLYLTGKSRFRQYRVTAVRGE